MAYEWQLEFNCDSGRRVGGKDQKVANVWAEAARESAARVKGKGGEEGADRVAEWVAEW